MDLKSRIAHGIKDIYWGDRWLQQLYSALALCRARWAELADEPYSALISYCNAARRARFQSLHDRRLEEFARFVGRYFGSQPPRTLTENVFVRSYLQSDEANQIRSVLRTWPFEKRVSLRRNLFLLKAPQDGERGVLLVQFAGIFLAFLANFRLDEIQSRYTLILEPGWYSHPEPYWALFSCHEGRAVCEAYTEELVLKIRSTKLPLLPVPIGSQDWVDTDLFRPLPSVPKEFDAAMVANYDLYKRHSVLFRAMRKLRPLRIRVALVAFENKRTRTEFEAEIRRFGVEDDCTIFEGLDAAGVNEVLNRSKVNLLLSKAEGGNRAVMESLAANVPCIVYKHMYGGVRRSDINPMTGFLADDDELPDVLLEAIRKHDKFEPRAWVLQNTGYGNATAKLNAALRQEAMRTGEKWTKDIMALPRRRESQLNLSEADQRSLTEGWKHLEKSLATL
jgi:glycosyltransferase involved in cell wall biosynthesis